MEDKLKTGYNNISKTFNNIIESMKNDMEMQQERLRQYEEDLNSVYDKLGHIEQTHYETEEYNRLFKKSRDLEAKINLVKEAIAENKAGLIEFGEL